MRLGMQDDQGICIWYYSMSIWFYNHLFPIHLHPINQVNTLSRSTPQQYLLIFLTPINGTSESRVKYVVEYVYVLGSFY